MRKRGGGTWQWRRENLYSQSLEPVYSVFNPNLASRKENFEKKNTLQYWWTKGRNGRVSHTHSKGRLTAQVSESIRTTGKEAFAGKVENAEQSRKLANMNRVGLSSTKSRTVDFLN